MVIMNLQMKKNKPLISVIVPVYNVEKYLDVCVKSIISQTYQNLEIILIDDGSTDLSSQKCDDWAKRDLRINTIHQQNAGQSVARNVGLNIAKGEYIGFVDSDDYIDEHMYEKLIDALSSSNKKIACCKAMVVIDEYKPIKNNYNVKFKDYGVKETVDAILNFEMGTSMWRRLYHKTIFDNIRFPEGEINEEYSIMIPNAVEANGTVFVDAELYYYRNRIESTSHRVHLSNEKLECVYKNLIIIEKQLEQFGLSCEKCYSLFAAKNSFNMLASLEKNYKILDEKSKELYNHFLLIAKKNKKAFYSSKNVCFKDKIVFWLIINKIYRLIKR